MEAQGQRQRAHAALQRLHGSNPPGGSIELGRLIDDYGDELEHDLSHYHGINLADVVAGAHSVRHVLVLVGQLPESSALLGAQLDREPITPGKGKPRWRGWTYDRFLLADIRDALFAANWQRGGGKSRKPEPSSRPSLKVPTGRDRLRSAARPPTSAVRRRGR